ncbi:DUF3011 domain-containing protein [Frateuria sp. Soil773]|uniref:DUF3011 domain-containing protein n=1 Tax=Frateuria sp. Soil773 TaxID=1736407 RepID=UPI0009E774DD|nr:DUF3011 domain-containing protein [Frateuria sp. Soil773]
MTRTCVVAALVSVFMLFAAPSAVAAISSFNVTCPGGIEVHADEGGPVFVNGREASLRKFSDNYYEARDAMSGVTLSINRTPGRGTQMSYTGKHGVNGICSIDSASAPRGTQADHSPYIASGSESANEVTCESKNNEQTECPMNTRGEVQITRRLSHSSCVEGQDWGLNRHSVWVRNGCRAVFRNVSRSDAYASESYSTHSGSTSKESADAAVAACKSALALKSGINSVFVLPVSHVPAAGGYEVFLSLKGVQWLCTTDSRGNVNRMEQR